MWKAEKIELTKNTKGKFELQTNYFADCFTLSINGEFIHNAINESFSLPVYFETLICDDCGQEGCNGAPMLMLRKYEGGILFLPYFDSLDSFQEYEWNTCKGDRECPPHKWYEDGILFVEEKMMSKFLSVLFGFKLEIIPEISKEEISKM